MKTLNKQILLLAIGLAGMTACNDFLDREPLDKVTPDNFLRTEDDLASYAIKQYDFTTHAEKYTIGMWGEDNHTDNHASSGNETNIKHYIGEVYFERAWNYFSKLQKFGDFPILRNTLPDEKETLIAASKRQPRNEVARFIISDLDSAIMLLSNQIAGGKNRITRNAALLVKSRVALFEASWLTYHRNTNRVPGGGPGWPGGTYSVDIDQEVAYCLAECKDAAAEVADQGLLAQNTGTRGMDNPYFAQFALESMEGCPEILLWRQYNKNDYNIAHGASSYKTPLCFSKNTTVF